MSKTRLKTTDKQIAANRRNAQKSTGPTTLPGKTKASRNAVKHGLLAQEAVVTVVEGAEDPVEFAALSQKLEAQFQPQGPLEEMLVEKIAVAYWRLRRAHRYEAGLFRQELDTAADKFYSETRLDGSKKHRTEDEIDEEIEQQEEAAANWQRDKRDLERLRKERTPLAEIYDWEENWEGLTAEMDALVPEDFEYDEDDWVRQLYEFLTTTAGWSDEDIWQALIRDCDAHIEPCRRRIAGLEQEKERNRYRIDILKTLANVPSPYDLNQLLRYEGAIERQFYKAIDQLERLQRTRAGQPVPPPVNIDVSVSETESS